MEFHSILPCRRFPRRRIARLSMAALVAISSAGGVTMAFAQGWEAPSVQRWAEPHELAIAHRPSATPLDRAAMARLQQAAETAFQQQQFRDALLGFTRLVAVDDRNVAAWFRLGNLYQRASDLTAASDAYHRVLSLAEAGTNDDGLRDKALMNLALLGLWRTRLALAELDRAPNAPGLAGERRSIEADLAQAEGRVRALSSARQSDPSAVTFNAAAVRPATVPASMVSSARRQAERVPAIPQTGADEPRRLGTSSRVEHFQGLPPVPVTGRKTPRPGEGSADSGNGGGRNGPETDEAVLSSDASTPRSKAMR